MAITYSYSNGNVSISSSSSSSTDSTTSSLSSTLTQKEEKQPSPKLPTNSLFGNVQSASSMKRQEDSGAGFEIYRQNMQGIRQGSGYKAPIIKPEKPYGVITGDNLTPKGESTTLLSSSYYSFSELVGKIIETV